MGKGGRKLGVRGGLVDKNNLLAAGPRIAIGRDARKARKADWQICRIMCSVKTKDNISCI